MRRRITSREGSPEGEHSPSTRTNNKRREISSLDRATDRIPNSGERRRSQGSQKAEHDHHTGSRDHGGRHRHPSMMDDKENLLAPRPGQLDDKNIHSAKTFRRGRIIIFLKQLQVKRSTLMQQLQQPEFKSIEQVISGELKAVDDIIQQFTHLFELREIESDDPTNL